MQRRYLPVIVSLVLLGVLGAILAPPAPPGRVIVMAVAVLATVALVYFCVYRALVYRAADRVVLDGDVLRVTRGPQEATIPVKFIAAIRSRPFVSPETITLDLATESELGRSITFIPPVRFPSGQEHPILAPLRATMRTA
jgi:uncharacterized membrane protein